MVQTALAHAIGLADGGSVWRYENGRALPSGPRLLKMASALGVSPEWIMTGDNPSPQQRAESDAADRAVEAYLRHDPTSKVLPPDLVSALRSIDFRDAAPTVGIVRALALAMLDESQRGGDGIEDTAVRRQSRHK